MERAILEGAYVLKILYVAKHDASGNDNEGAIRHALSILGHTVKCYKEHQFKNVLSQLKMRDFDFLLFHKWSEFETIKRVSIPRVFWYFDQVYNTDRTLTGRVHQRVVWMKRAMPLVSLGFCTDGDWVQKDTTGKLVHLLQGADERVMGFGQPEFKRVPITFIGRIQNGSMRANHIAVLKQTYNKQFQIVNRLHGRGLSNLIASTKVVIAPMGLCTNHYWSNRVYLLLGFGAFLLHPYCEGLTRHYLDQQHIVYYTSVKAGLELIDYYLGQPELRESISRAAYEHTKAHHTYRLRCQELIKTIQTRL